MEGAGQLRIAGLEHLWLPYAQMQTASAPLPVARTEGCRIVLEDGRALIDGTASWWTACHGYNHPHILQAVEAQLATMPHVMLAGLAHRPAATLAARLAKLLPGDLDHVFFSDSGSVAVEIALKMAVQFFRNRGEDRHTIVAFENGYHGDTMGAMAVSDPATGFQGRLVGDAAQPIIALQDPEALDRTLASGGVAALIVEPLVQGAGGMLFHDANTLMRIRQAADRHDALLIFDEIFTGFGRTGGMFAMETAGVRPDIVTLSKALTGGTLSLAATVASRRVYEGFLSSDPQDALMHGPTFMGNALACAAANASLDLFEREPRLAQVAAIATQMTQELAPCRVLPGVKDVRVRGAIGVVELERLENADEMRRRFVAEGVWIRPFGRTVYLTPSFTIASADLSVLTAAVGRVFRR